MFCAPIATISAPESAKPVVKAGEAGLDHAASVQIESKVGYLNFLK
jgi:hypothetical protein